MALPRIASFTCHFDRVDSKLTEMNVPVSDIISIQRLESGYYEVWYSRSSFNVEAVKSSPNSKSTKPRKRKVRS